MRHFVMVASSASVRTNTLRMHHEAVIGVCTMCICEMLDVVSLSWSARWVFAEGMHLIISFVHLFRASPATNSLGTVIVDFLAECYGVLCADLLKGKRPAKCFLAITLAIFRFGDFLDQYSIRYVHQIVDEYAQCTEERKVNVPSFALLPFWRESAFVLFVCAWKAPKISHEPVCVELELFVRGHYSLMMVVCEFDFWG